MALMAQVSHRDRLLQSAIECLQTKGYARTTARDIAAGANANLASIGYHFGSKEDLLTEALLSISEQWLTRLGELAIGPADLAPLDRVLASFAHIAATHAANRPILAAFAEALAEAERAPELRKQLAAHYQTSRHRVAAMITTGLGDAGTSLSPEQAETAASAIIALGDGFQQQWRLDPENAPDGAALLTALAEVFTLAAGLQHERA
jgi:AcrR family transcriptional regulator